VSLTKLGMMQSETLQKGEKNKLFKKEHEMLLTAMFG